MRTLRIVSGGLAALALTAGLAATPADARDRHRDGLSAGAAATIGILGGLAVGTAIGAASQPAYGAPVYVAPAPTPVYVRRPRTVYVEPVCYVEQRREWVPGWGWQIREREICG